MLFYMILIILYIQQFCNKTGFSSSIVIGCANAGFKMRVKGFTWLSASHLCLFGAFSGLLRLFLWLQIHFLGFGFGFLEGAISGIIHGRYQKGVSSFLRPFLCVLKEIQVCYFCYLLCFCQLSLSCNKLGYLFGWGFWLWMLLRTIE